MRDDVGFKSDYLHLNTVSVVPVQNLHGLDCFRNGSASADEDAVDVESESKILGDVWIERGRGHARGCERGRRRWRAAAVRYGAWRLQTGLLQGCDIFGIQGIELFSIELSVQVVSSGIERRGEAAAGRSSVLHPGSQRHD